MVKVAAKARGARPSSWAQCQRSWRTTPMSCVWRRTHVTRRRGRRGWRRRWRGRWRGSPTSSQPGTGDLAFDVSAFFSLPHRTFQKVPNMSWKCLSSSRFLCHLDWQLKGESDLISIKTSQSSDHQWRFSIQPDLPKTKSWIVDSTRKTNKIKTYISIYQPLSALLETEQEW